MEYGALAVCMQYDSQVVCLEASAHDFAKTAARVLTWPSFAQRHWGDIVSTIAKPGPSHGIGQTPAASQIATPNCSLFPLTLPANPLRPNYSDALRLPAPASRRCPRKLYASASPPPAAASPHRRPKPSRPMPRRRTVQQTQRMHMMTGKRIIPLFPEKCLVNKYGSLMSCDSHSGGR